MGYEGNWRKICNCEFEFEGPGDGEYKDELMDIEEAEEKNDTFVFKKVEDVVKVRGNKKKNVLKNSGDVMQDVSWLSETDKIMLGIKEASSIPIPAALKKAQPAGIRI